MLLSQKGHNIVVGARKKEFTLKLLEAYGIHYKLLTMKGNGVIKLLIELMLQQFKILNILKRKRFDLMLQIGGIFNAPIGRLFNIPTVAISDTENDRWGNKLSFSLSRHVFLPTCFDRENGGTWPNQLFYPGYHELAYLAPHWLSEPVAPQAKFFIRFVGWGAGHDIGEKYLTNNQKIELVRILQNFGTVHISSEMPLPEAIDHLHCRIPPERIHGFMQTCKLVVGESATMASEAACLGLPAIFISDTGRGYTTEQDCKYDLIRHYRLNQWLDILDCTRNWASQDMHSEWQNKRWRMLRDKIDVTAWLVDLVENYPKSIQSVREGDFSKYRIQCVE